MLRNYEDALKDFNSAIKLEPKNAWAIANRGLVLIYKSRFKEALTDFDKAISLEPRRHWYYYYRAITYLILDDLGLAHENLLQAIALAQTINEENPGDLSNKFNLVLYTLALGNIELSEQYFREAFKGIPSPYLVRLIIFEFDDFLTYFPNNKKAQRLKKKLHEYLEARRGE